MALVLDASTVLDWAFDEGHPAAAVARERLRTDTALTPSLWWFEVRNGLLMAERRGRYNETRLEAFLREMPRFPISLDQSPNETTIISLARRHRLTVYDASYLELALRERLPLATLDASLAEAARREGVAVIGDSP